MPGDFVTVQASLPIYHRWKGRTPRFTLTPEIAEQIRKIYREKTGDGEVRDLARRLCIPRWRISRWALHLGVVELRKKEPDWSDAELAVLERWGHLTIERIQIKLKLAGFQRSLMGILLKRKRMRIPANFEEYTATKLAECFGVYVKTVTRWIVLGYLRAGKRGTDRSEAQGGDMWWIREKDVRRFVVENVELVDFRKVDKVWLVDLLTTRKEKAI